MTCEQKEFANKYHYKIVKPLGNYYKLPIKKYIVTTALLNWEDNNTTTIFAIKALDYNLENKHWITIKIAEYEFDKCIADFEIIGDGYEDYVKPIILDEVLNTWDEENGYWTLRYSSYIFPEKYGKVNKIPKFDIKRDIHVGLNEYMFIYKSIFDIDKPSCYIISLPPNLRYKEQMEKWIQPLRQDVLANRIIHGINYRLLQNQT